MRSPLVDTVRVPAFNAIVEDAAGCLEVAFEAFRCLEGVATNGAVSSLLDVVGAASLGISMAVAKTEPAANGTVLAVVFHTVVGDFAFSTVIVPPPCSQ